MKKKIILDLQLACNDLYKIPSVSTFKTWIQCIFSNFFKKKIELTIRIVDEKESQLLNMYFLKKNYPTDILSFIFYPPPWINTPFLGDLIICQKIIEYKAKKNKISTEMQMAYAVIHGSLHLLGYDHITYEEDNNMKNLENQIMKKLGYTYNII